MSKMEEAQRLAADSRATGATESTNEALDTLRKLEASGDRARIGFTLSNSFERHSDKEEIMTAREAIVAVEAMARTADLVGYEIRFTIFRIEGAI